MWPCSHLKAHCALAGLCLTEPPKMLPHSRPGRPVWDRDSSRDAPPKTAALAPLTASAIQLKTPASRLYRTLSDVCARSDLGF